MDYWTLINFANTTSFYVIVTGLGGGCSCNRTQRDMLDQTI